MSDHLHLTVAVPVEKVAGFYTMLGALLAGTAPAALTASEPRTSTPTPTPTATTGESQGDGPQAAALKAAGEQTAGNAATDAGDPNDVDAGGYPWSADLHASTKGKTKDGYWRMKVGVSRPDPKPGFPKADAAPTAANPSSESGAASASSTPAATVEEDDEFAAFAAAANKSDATDAAAAANVPARTWTDADLGLLCNQAAVKLGDPAPVKALIVAHVPEGTVPHSRNIPADQRETFAKAVEAKAGITFAAA